MNLALVLGKNSDNIKPTLAFVKDNLNISGFTTLKQFIAISTKRELFFDRIIIISTLLKDDSTIDDIYNFWNSNSRASEIVFLCRKDSDEALAKTFLSKFCSTSVTCMLVSATTLNILRSAVVLPISEITEMYGISDYLTVEVE